MRIFTYISLITLELLSFSCGKTHADIMKEFNRLKEGNADPYTMAYAYATYLSTTKSIKAEEAIPLINELISMANPTAARYCIDNLERNGIQSWDLVALRGLCYQHELQPGLARSELEAALEGDPGNEKIRTLMKNLEIKYTEKSVLPTHEALFRQGMASLQNLDYDSALYYMKQASQMEERPEYSDHVIRTESIIEGEKMMLSSPGNPRGYILKAQGLSALRLFLEAQRTLDAGLIACPDNLNLILAKALVWVQAGETETARQYLWEQEQKGIDIDPSVKQRILEPQNKTRP